MQDWTQGESSGTTYGQTDPSAGRESKGTEAGQRVEELSGRTQQHAAQFVDRGKAQAAEQLSRLARAVRDTGGSLEKQGGGALASFAAQAADRIERISHMTRSSEPRDAIRAVEDFARREPAMFLGGAVALGLLASRFLRSKPPEYDRPERGAFRAVGVQQSAAMPPAAYPPIGSVSQPPAGREVSNEPHA